MKPQSATLYFRARGARTGLPVVVLEAGGGMTSASWAWIEDELARHTLVLSYDRAGTGRSSAMHGGVDAESVAAALEAVLAPVGGPYLLVGHSAGALLAEYFAATRPGQVAGLALIDPTPRDPGLVPTSAHVAGTISGLVLAGMQALAWLGLFRLRNPFAAAILKSGLPDWAKAELVEATTKPRHIGTVRRELFARVRVQNALLAALASHPLPAELPVLVVSAGQRRRPGEDKPLPPHLQAYLDGVERDHRTRAAHSRRGTHVVATQADHGSLLSDPLQAAEVSAHILRLAQACAVRI